MHFERMADEYATARPPYPAVLYAELSRRGVIGPGLRVLEIGAGAGLATTDLVAVGAEVTAVEPGERLAELLTSRVPSATVLVSTLEAAVLTDHAYDAAVAATSLHWVDLEAGLPILHRALRPGGWLAVWRTHFGDSSLRTAFRDQVDVIVGARPPAPQPAVSRDDRPTLAELTTDGWFEHVDSMTWAWPVQLSTAQVKQLYSTFSNWTPDEVEAAVAAADRCGGTVNERFRTVLHLLRAV